MTDSTFVEVSKKNEDNYRYDTFTLYFADKSGKRLLKETRNVYYRRTLPKERVVLEQLAKGPSGGRTLCNDSREYYGDQCDYGRQNLLS